MKKYFPYIAIVVAFAVPVTALAAEFRIGEQPAVLANEKVSGDVYLIGGGATDSGEVAGDVVAAGGNVIVSGDVGADLMVGGGNISIFSNVGDDIRIGGGNIVIQGSVGGDVIVGGGQVTIGGSGVGGDVVAGVGNLRIDAPVAGNLKVGGGNVYINAPIKGDININADKVTLGPSAVIYGKMSYKAKKEMIKEEGADVRGEVKYTPRADRKVPAALIAGLISAWIIGKFLVLLACALIIGLVFHRYSSESVAKAMNRPLLELGRGLLVLIVLPIASIILMVTVIGIPLGILGFIALFAFMLLSWIIAPIIIGSFVYNYFSGDKMEVSWKTILLGVFIFQILGFVPFIGWLMQVATILISVGVIAAIKSEVLQEWR